MYMRKIKPGGSSAIKRWQTNRRYVCLHIDLWFLFFKHIRGRGVIAGRFDTFYRACFIYERRGKQKKVVAAFLVRYLYSPAGKGKKHKLFVIFWNFAQLTLVDDVGASPRHKFRIQKKKASSGIF